MTSPEPQPAPVRPRKRRRSAEANGVTPADPYADQRMPKVTIDPRLRELHGAIEDLRIAATALHLPPMRLEWDQPADPDDLRTPEQQDLRAHVESFLADYEGLRNGPLAWSLPDIAAPENPDTFLVDKLIRPGTTVMLAGPPGAAKSWAARQLPLAAASGQPWFLERYGIDRPLNCLIVDEDNGPDEEWRRETSILEHLGVERSALPNVRRVSLEGVQLDQEPWQRWLRGQIRLNQLDLLVLDPISEFHGGKELREDPAFRSVLAFLKRLKVDFPHLATLVVHHTRKLDAKDRTAHRGLEDVRGQWGQTPDVVVVMSPLGERRTKWEVHKRVPFSSLILEQIEQGHPGQGALRMVADETVMQTRAMANDGAVIDAIRGGFELFADIQQAIGMPKSTLSNVLNRLVRAGVVKKSGRSYSAPEDD